MNILYVVLGALALIVLWVVFAYNRFIKLSYRAKEAWSDIEVHLKRRYDLIPNLVETVKSYAKHESSTFENVTKARAAAISGSANPHEQAAKENMLAGALK